MFYYSREQRGEHPPHSRCDRTLIALGPDSPAASTHPFKAMRIFVQLRRSRQLEPIMNLLCAHLVVNMLTVDVTNFALSKTICPETLLTCCDPFSNIQPMVLGFPVNGWLLGHLIAYWWTGYYHGKNSVSRHAELVLCQVAWYCFEYFSFLHVWDYEREKYYPDGNHPCPTNAYFSTWIPIVEDFMYNSVGQALGWWLYARVQKRRASHVSICDDKEPLHTGGNTHSSDVEFSRMV